MRFIRQPSTQKSSLICMTNAIDSDVINEKIKVNSMTPLDIQANNLVLQNLTKFYGDFLAVKGISVAIKRYVNFQLKHKIEI